MTEQPLAAWWEVISGARWFAGKGLSAALVDLARRAAGRLQRHETSDADLHGLLDRPVHALMAADALGEHDRQRRRRLARLAAGQSGDEIARLRASAAARGPAASAARADRRRPCVVRFEDGKLAEHWDVIQDEATKEASVSGLPMFGDSFPG